MADDLKTMSGFVMGLLDRMDEEDKVKSFVPPINIPPPTGGYEYSPNIQKIIDKGQKSFTQRALHDMYKRSGEDPGVQDYLVETYGFKPNEEPRSLFSSDPERMKMFFGDSDKIVPEPKDLNIPKESTPPIVPEKQVPYQDAGEYMRNYFAENQEALDNREPIPRRDMLRSDGSTKSARGFLGAFPDRYGKMMTEQTISVEIDGKEVEMPAIVPTTTPDEIELLASGNVNWQSPRGQLIRDKAVANYRDRVSRGLSPYYQDGEGDVPPVQAVPADTEARYANLFGKDAVNQKDPMDPYRVNVDSYLVPVSGSVPKPDTPEETIKEVTLVDDGLDQEYKIPFSEVERIVNRASQFEFGGKKPDDDTLRYLYDSSGRDPRVLDAFKSKYQYEFKEKDSAGGFRPLITKIEENIEEGKRKRLEEQEKYNEFVRGQRVDRLTQQAEDLGFDLVSKDVPPVDGAGIPKKDDAAMQAGIDNIIKGMEEEQKQLSQQDSDAQVTQVTEKDVKEAPSKLTTDTKKLVDESMSQADFPRMMIGDDGEFAGDNQNTIDGKEPKPGFFKSIWNAIKDIAREGFEDPSLRKALFAYTASRVLGYDGVTLAASVLENEWQKQAAEAKAEKEAEAAKLEFDRERTLLDIENQQQIALQRGKDLSQREKDYTTFDYSNPIDIYDPASKRNYTASLNNSKDGIKFDVPMRFAGIDANGKEVVREFSPSEIIPLSFLRQVGYKIGKGDTVQDITSSYSKFAKDQAKIYLKNYYDTPDFTKLKEPQQRAIKAQANNLFDENAINEVISVVRSTLPAGSFEKGNLDFNRALDQGMRDAVNAIASGRSVDNAYLSAAIIEKKLTLDKDIKIRPYDFKFNPNVEQFKDYKDSKIGLNSLTRVMFDLKSPAADLGVDEFKILSHLSDKYSSLDPKMKDEYISFAVNSLEDDNAAQEAVTPFMSYVLKKLDNDNLSATLKDLRDHFKSK